MGKRLFQKVFVSPDRTQALGLSQLQVVSELDEADKKETTYHTVHSSYFTKDKPVCPVCGSTTYQDVYEGEDGIVGCDECVRWLSAEEWWEELEEEKRW